MKTNNMKNNVQNNVKNNFKNKKYKIIKQVLIFSIIYFFFIIVFTYTNISYGSDQSSVKINKWDVDVFVKKNGDIEIEEKWDVSFKGITTLYREFNLSKSDIKNAKIFKIENKNEFVDNNINTNTNTNTNTNNINNSNNFNNKSKDSSKTILLKENNFQLRQDLDKYHIDINPDSRKLELGWGVSNSKENIFKSAKYKLNYTLKGKEAGILTRYEDSSDLYYKFLDDSNTTTSSSLILNVSFEGGKVDKENAKIWGHGAKNAQIHFENGIVKAYAKPIDKNQMFEVRVLFPSEYLSGMKVKKGKGQEIVVAEEEKFVEQTIKAEKRKQNIFTLVKTIISIFGIYAIINLIKAIYYYIKARKIEKQIIKSAKADAKVFEYFTDIPEYSDLDIIKIRSMFPARKKNRRDEFYDKDHKNVLTAILLKLIYLDLIKTEIVKEKGLFKKAQINMYLNNDKFKEILEQDKNLQNDLDKSFKKHYEQSGLNLNDPKIKRKEYNRYKKKYVNANRKRKQLNDIDIDIFKFLQKTDKDNNGIVTTKEFSKNIKKYYLTKIYTPIENKIDAEIKKQQDIGILEINDEYEKYINKANKVTNSFLGKYILIIIPFIFLSTVYIKMFDNLFMPIFYFVFTVFMMIFHIVNSLVFINLRKNKEGIITAKGLSIESEINGLYKQLDEGFISEHDEKGLIIWEKYLIYATVFGIGEKVLKEIKEKYPNIQNQLEQNIGYNSSIILLNNINTYSGAMESGYASNFTQPSYGSSSYSRGSGGGFSGGGGGGGGGGGAGGR